MQKTSESTLRELYSALLRLETEADCRDLLADLCTHKEIENMAQRIRAARLLAKGETYTDIIAETGIASATLARVSTALRYGNGYKKFIAETADKAEEEQ